MSVAPSKNLLIVHTPFRQDIADWIDVKARIAQRAPDIEVRIATNGSRQPVTARWQVSRPSLVFSPSLLEQYHPRGGAVFAGQNMPKTEQLRRLAAHGVPVPRTVPLTPDLVLDPAVWGEHVIVKPVDGRSGRRVRLVRTADLPARRPALTGAGMPPMLVQPYIPHAEDGYPTEYRVLTLFGRVLYCARNRWGRPLGKLAEIAADPRGIIASNDKSQGGRVRVVCNDAEIIALGEKAHAAFPECGLAAVDIVRDTGCGRLHVMEMNFIGGVWHFSSNLAKTTFTAEHVRDLYAQFDALERTAELLVQKTRVAAI